MQELTPYSKPSDQLLPELLRVVELNLESSDDIVFIRQEVLPSLEHMAEVTGVTLGFIIKVYQQEEGRAEFEKTDIEAARIRARQLILALANRINPCRRSVATDEVRARVEEFCLNQAQLGRDIYKRIDENRELLELIIKEAPDLLERCPWIAGWIAGTDCFLVNLLCMLGWQQQNPASELSPRPWPVNKFWPWLTQKTGYFFFSEPKKR